MKAPEKRVEQLVLQYKDKDITNYQMLLGLGEVFFTHPDNEKVKTEYFNRMIISGYASWALHYYLAFPEKIQGVEDEKIILFALRKGNHYNLANAFDDYFSRGNIERLNEIKNLADSLAYYNQLVAETGSPLDYTGRGNFFFAVGESDMAAIDIGKSLKLDPCNPDALFQRALALFEVENTKEIVRSLNRCRQESFSSGTEWTNVFMQLAKDVELVHASEDVEQEKLFRLANLYVNNGFPVIALRKSGRLIQIDPSNADYLALHAFVYYRNGDKRNAIRYLNDAESITGRKSRLRDMIEQME